VLTRGAIDEIVVSTARHDDVLDASRTESVDDVAPEEACTAGDDDAFTNERRAGH